MSKIETFLLSEGIGGRRSLACEAKDYLAVPEMTQAVSEKNMDDDNTQWSWTDDMRKRIADEMVLHVDLDYNGIAKGSDLTEAAKSLSENAGYREEFERLVAISRDVVRDVVGQPERHE